MKYIYWGSRLYRMVLVYGMADSCLDNKQNNTWTLGDIEFIFSFSHSISHLFDIDVNSPYLHAPMYYSLFIPRVRTGYEMIDSQRAT